MEWRECNRLLCAFPVTLDLLLRSTVQACKERSYHHWNGSVARSHLPTVATLNIERRVESQHAPLLRKAGIYPLPVYAELSQQSVRLKQKMHWPELDHRQMRCPIEWERKQSQDKPIVCKSSIAFCLFLTWLRPNQDEHPSLYMLGTNYNSDNASRSLLVVGLNHTIRLSCGGSF